MGKQRKIVQISMNIDIFMSKRYYRPFPLTTAYQTRIVAFGEIKKFLNCDAIQNREDGQFATFECARTLQNKPNVLFIGTTRIRVEQSLG